MRYQYTRNFLISLPNDQERDEFLTKQYDIGEPIDYSYFFPDLEMSHEVECRILEYHIRFMSKEPSIYRIVVSCESSDDLLLLRLSV